MRTPLLAANWKMYKTTQEAVAYVRELRPLVETIDGVTIVIATPFTALGAVVEAVRGSSIGIAGQDLHWETEGAFTGAVSANMLKGSGASWVIVGHSERRRLFGDTDETVNRKTKSALAADLLPIVCVGETLEERDSGKTFEVLDRQVVRGLEAVSATQVAALVLAYEPVWAIGTGRNATPDQAGEAHAHLRDRLRQSFGADAAESCRILYGGSVKPANASDLVGQPDVDGALVGGASLDPRSFFEIVARSREATV